MSSASRITDNRNLFTEPTHSEIYQRFRPTYPPAVFKTIFDFLDASLNNSIIDNHMTKQYNLAVDMACGTGQATATLAKHFTEVIGCDVSKSQIDVATHHNQFDNVVFQVAPSEDVPFVKDGSVDLVTFACAFHYVDPDATYLEVLRILRPGGVLAIFGYGLTELPTEEAQNAFLKFFDNALKDNVSPQMAIVLNHYHDLSLPFDDITRKNDLSIEKDVTLSSYIGFLKSLYLYQAHLASHPGSNTLQEFADQLKSILAPGAAKSEDPTFHISLPVFMVMGRKK